MGFINHFDDDMPSPWDNGSSPDEMEGYFFHKGNVETNVSGCYQKVKASQIGVSKAKTLYEKVDASNELLRTVKVYANELVLETLRKLSKEIYSRESWDSTVLRDLIRNKELEMRETISLTNISRLDLTLPDGLGKVKYSAECDNHFMKLHYTTNGDERKHLTLEEWIEKATELFKEKIRQDSL